jgi:hypothetical protein
LNPELFERRIEGCDRRQEVLEALDLDEGELSGTALGKPRGAGIAS